MLKWIRCVCASIALVLDFKAQQRGDAQANGPGSFAMAHQPQRSSGAAFEGQIGFSWVVSGCFWAVCSCLLMLISRFVNSFCWCVFFDIFWHVAMKSILYAVLFLVLRITPWSKRVAAQALTPELALKSELEAQRRVLSKVGRWSQWNHGGPLRHGGPPGSDGKFPQGRLGNMGNAIGEYWKWEINSLFVLLFDTLMSISQAQMLMGDYQVAKMECVYVCLADDVEKVWNNKTIDFLAAVWERKLDTTGGVTTGQMMVNPPDTSLYVLSTCLSCCYAVMLQRTPLGRAVMGFSSSIAEVCYPSNP